jgi:hypothetical protein
MKMEDGGEEKDDGAFNDEEPSKMFTFEDNPHLQ